MTAGNVSHLALVLAGVLALFAGGRSVVRGRITTEKDKGGLVFAVGVGLLFIGYGLFEFYGIRGTEIARPVNAILLVVILVAFGGYLYAKGMDD